MPPKRSSNKETLDTRRRMMRSQRSSPEDLVSRRVIIRPHGEPIWQPPLPEGSVGVSKEPVPTEIWFRLSEPKNYSYAGTTSTSCRCNYANWLDTVRTRWTGRKIAVYFVSFDPVSIKTDVFEVLRAMKDRAMTWPTKLLTDGKNITSTAILDQILTSSLDEIEVYVAGLGESKISPRVLGAVKDLRDLREARGQKQPTITCRLCPGSANASKMIADVTQWVKQAGIDRLEVADKQTEQKRLWE